MDEKKDVAKDDRVLLPDSVTPTTYDLTLHPDLKTFQFDGNCKISVIVNRETDTISLHAKELHLKSATFTTSEGEKINAVGINIDLKLTVAVFKFPKALSPGTGIFEIIFTGCLNDKMAGFYRSKYKSVSGEDTYMASTQFEALDARRCFPCWDEPAVKATFKCTLVTAAHLHAFSNMPATEVSMLKDGKKSWIFDETPKMSTYLLAFCVGEFDYVQAFTKSLVTVRVYTPPGKKDQGRFSLDLAVKTLELYEDYFKIPYPLPKLDMVAIPEFAMGAMENWGLVTYREVEILIDAASASNSQLQRVALVITHELAHQWFGNLVTMEWWDNLWLNEGFASFMQTWSRDKIYPDWQMWEQFTITERESALKLDSLKSSHPIQVPIKHAEEVEEVFDLISYNKGSCVVRMIYCMLGPELFREGLELYFKRHAYGNTITTDLWAAWAKVSGKPIEKIMACWTLQMGFPVVTVVKCSQGSSSKEAVLTLKQQWFLADGGEVKEEESKLWSIPLFIGKKDGKGAELVMMDDKEAEVKVSLVNGPGDWITINYGEYSLFRTVYTPDMLVNFEKAIRSQDRSLPSENRAAIISDTYAFVKAGKVDVAKLIHLIDACAQDTSYIVWYKISEVLNSLDVFLQEFSPAIYAKYQQFAARISKRGFQEYGWNASDDDGHLGKLARAIFIRLQAKFETKDKTLLNEASRRFHEYCTDPEANASVLPSDYIVSIFRLVLKTGDSARYNELKNLYGKLKNNVDRRNILVSLGYTADIALKKDTLRWTLESVVLQDFFYPIRSVQGSGPKGKEMAWSYFKDKLQAFKDKVGNSAPNLMCAAISASAGGFTSKEKADEIEKFFKENPIDGTERKIKQMVENMRINAVLVENAKKSPANDEKFWDSLL